MYHRAGEEDLAAASQEIVPNFVKTITSEGQRTQLLFLGAGHVTLMHVGVMFYVQECRLFSARALSILPR
jgi:hypothetical protein